MEILYNEPNFFNINAQYNFLATNTPIFHVEHIAWSPTATINICTTINSAIHITIATAMRYIIYYNTIATINICIILNSVIEGEGSLVK